MAKLKLPFELEKPSSNEYVTQASEIGYGGIPAACGLIYDISVANAVDNAPAKYESLSAALGTNGANIPQDIRKGGMSIKFIQSSDNKYVQYRYMGTAVTGTPNPFLDTANWQGIDNEPTAGSNNLVKSNGTWKENVGLLQYFGLKNCAYLPCSIYQSKYLLEFSKSILLRVSSGDILKIKRGADNIYIGFLTDFIMPTTNNEPVTTFCNELTYEYISGTTEFTFEVPSDCKFVLVSTSFKGVDDRTPSSLTINGLDILGGLQKEISDLKQSIAQNTSDLKQSIAQNTSDIAQNTSDIEYLGFLLTGNTEPINIGTIDSNISSYTKILDISIIQGTKFRFKITGNGNIGRFLFLCNHNVRLQDYCAFDTWYEITAPTNITSFGYNTSGDPNATNVVFELESTGYEQHLIDYVDNNCVKINSSNIVDWENVELIVNRYYKGSTGALTPGNGTRKYMCLPLIKVIPNTNYYLSCLRNGIVSTIGLDSTEATICFYAENVVSSFISSINGATMSFVTPSTAYYIGISLYEYDNITEPCFQIGTERKYSEYNPISGYLKDPESSENAVSLISLPDKIYSVVGETTQIFHRSCIQAVEPCNYNIVVVCNIGVNYPRYYEVTPVSNNIGNHTLTYYVYDNNGNLLCSKSITLVVVDTLTSPSSQKNILVVSDSIYANGYIVAELKRRLVGAGGTPAGLGLSNISFIGRRNAQNVNFEAVGGYSWRTYSTDAFKSLRFYVSGINQLHLGDTYTIQGVSISSTYYLTIIEINTGGVDPDNILCEVYGGYIYGSGVIPSSGSLIRRSGSGDETITYTSFITEPGNPFWNGSTNKLDFINYSNQYCGGANIDILVTQLGGNGIRTISNVDETIENNIKPFIRQFHIDYPSSKILIGGIIPLCISGLKYANQTMQRYNLLKTYLYYLEQIQVLANDAEFSSYIIIADTMGEFDSEYGYPLAEKPVFSRSSYKELISTNAQHPSLEGDYLLSDVWYKILSFIL